MKKNKEYILLLLLFLLAVSFTIMKYYNEKKLEKPAYYTLLERKGALAKVPEWTLVRTNAENLIKTVRINPDDLHASLALAALFVQEARATGNYKYYDQAALKYIDDVLQKDSSNFQALLLKAVVFLSQHHFSEGLAVAEQAQKMNPYNAFVYGIMVDSHVELGNYKEAVKNADKMVSIRPDMRSYSRIAYLREIHGDYPGAIQAMQMAVESGIPGDEGTEWCRYQLGRLYEKTGNLNKAEIIFKTTLQYRNSYPYALAGLARIAVVLKEYQQARKYYFEAIKQINDYAFREELAEVYELSNIPSKASEIRKLLIDEMLKESVNSDNNSSHGHYSDGELALVYLKGGNLENALQHALMEYNRRPKNIDVNETLAWVYFKKGDIHKAKQHITNAVKTGSKNPVLLCRAGLIAAESGDLNKAKYLLQQGLRNKVYMDEEVKTESMRTLGQLN